MRVEFPTFDQKHVQARFEFNREDVEELLEELEEHHDYLPGLFDAAVELLARGCVVAPEDPIVFRAASVAARAAGAMFTLHAQSSRGETPGVAFRRPDDTVIELAEPPSSSLGPINWQYGMCCALIARDEAAQLELGITTAHVIGASGVQADLYQYEWIAILKSLHRGERLAGMVDELEATASPDKVEISSPLHVREVVSLARAADAIDRDDSEAFHEHLRDALVAHREIWQGQNNWRANASLGALALACVAHDRGFPIAIDSEYLPDALVYNEFGDDGGVDVSGDE